MTGKGTSGSWQIRGEQLGRAMGAAIVPRAVDVPAFDIAVVIKRPPVDTVRRIHKAGIPLVWDVVDAWPQPLGNDWNCDQARQWLAAEFAWIKPAAIVTATRAMEADCVRFGVPVLTVPHHARPGLARTPIRPLRVIGYEGGVQHLGQWATWFDLECHRRGWVFHVEQQLASINDADVVIAMRERHGYAPRNWKSNVKLANAQGSGTPIICGREAGYLETASGGERFADTPAEVLAALDELADEGARRAAADLLAARAPALKQVAAGYRTWLEGLCSKLSS